MGHYRSEMEAEKSDSELREEAEHKIKANKYPLQAKVGDEVRFADGAYLFMQGYSLFRDTVCFGKHGRIVKRIKKEKGETLLSFLSSVDIRKRKKALPISRMVQEAATPEWLPAKYFTYFVKSKMKKKKNRK